LINHACLFLIASQLIAPAFSQFYQNLEVIGGRKVNFLGLSALVLAQPFLKNTMMP
jgi:hypothetical protein